MDSLSESSTSSYHGKRPRSLSDDSQNSSNMDDGFQKSLTPEKSGENAQNPPSISQQKEIIADFVNNQPDLEEGRTDFYILSYSWYEKLCSYLSEEGPFPGELDQEDIMNLDDGSLKSNLQEEIDFTIISKELWDLLTEWYGLKGNEFPRETVNLGSEDYPHLVVEVYPPNFSLTLLSLQSDPYETHKPLKITLSSKSTLNDLFEGVKYTLSISGDNFRLWRVDTELPLQRTIDPSSFIKISSKEIVESLGKEKTLVESGMDSSCALVVECMYNETWPVDRALRLQFLIRQRDQKSSVSLENRESKVLGTCGLNNLGNTCYMNSALQCLTHTRELRDFFLSDEWKDQVNESNPLGMSGQIAAAFASLVKSLYNPDHTSFAPRQFKAIIGRFNHSFLGYGQQDSQEFLAFLLDGLHEDLNRIYQKPYTSKPDLYELDEEKIRSTADECWRLHKLRNDSIIVDLFQGMYRSTLVCPECKTVSITFDPFMDLTLPLPLQQFWSHPVVFIPSDVTRRPITVDVILENKSATIGDLVQFVASKVGCDNYKRILVTETYRGRFYRFLTSLTKSLLMEISEEDEIYLYELEKPLDEASDEIIVPVYHTINPSPKSSNSYLDNREFGYPFILQLKDAEINNASEIEKKLKTKYSQFTTLDSLKDAECLESLNSNLNEGKDLKSNESSKDNERKTPLFNTKVFHDRYERIPTGWNMHPTNLPLLTDRDVESLQATVEPSINIDPFDGDEGENQANEAAPGSYPDPPKIEKTTQKNTNLLVQGDLLVCEWPEASQHHVFNESPSSPDMGRSLWLDMERIMSETKEEDNRSHTITLDDCLNEFEKTEQLGEEDPWYCPKCKDFRRASKEMRIWKSPEILIFHLKRFSSERRFRDKIDELIEFPIDNLDLSNHTESQKFVDADENGKCVYELCAVDNHYGGLGGGHYTSFARNPDDNQFYCYDDSRVSPVKPEETITSAAYLLFYRRKST
ncbi:ubiquitin carboxy terminal hydrolase Ubp12 [Schizosaccharomyces cryophilus OY26]|uniref:Ubiquitin carboxyl-terminal hydrolase n=1 Tax=Schizosaccharomyces cryophilus (strain OY26 / ATCC MYA-4695 / CBS 11777 / NBRC 106824 / NRRL Y48691) TaxID=653667 RepID=S9VVH6_SCHCR|nr:ubiquitin carboxy terminal hydrolase Ubp12 [Schizosaccharomyces cryophilus OY26]EPY50105.1 ubiquitin carboxy terminal hydrolase Ubp12 [Schizosaccharomyces cryophilus OY26]